MARADQQSLAAIFLVFCSLLIFSTLIDASEERFTIRQRFGGHITIILIVIVSTTYFNQTILFTPREVKSQIQRPISYDVAIPYYDLSFRAYVGDKLGGRRLVYITTVSAASPVVAISMAKAKFWDITNKDVTPFDPKKQKSTSELLIDADHIFATPTGGSVQIALVNSDTTPDAISH